MGGRAPYGFRAVPFRMDGINTKKLVRDDQEMEHVRLMFEMYAEPEVSYGDIVRYFSENGIRDFSRASLACILCNPIYAQADLDVYEFFKSQGTNIVNDAADFTGMNGCYFYRGRGKKGATKHDLEGHTLVLAPSEGEIPSYIWLKCRRKILANDSYQPGRKAKNTWLAGKIKCGRCGRALKAENSCGNKYFRCSKRSDNKSCIGAGTLRVVEMEKLVFQEMTKRLAPLKTLCGHTAPVNVSPQLTAAQVELTQIAEEIEKLVDSLTGASPVLLSYVNSKVEALDQRKQVLVKRIAELRAEEISPDQLDKISDYLAVWNDVSFDDKRKVADLMISSIQATSECIHIDWKF